MPMTSRYLIARVRIDRIHLRSTEIHGSTRSRNWLETELKCIDEPSIGADEFFRLTCGRPRHPCAVEFLAGTNVDRLALGK